MRYSDMPTPKKKLSPLKSIRFYCRYICCASDVISWKKCSANRCALYSYRLGKGNRIKTIKTSEKTSSRPTFLSENKVNEPYLNTDIIKKDKESDEDGDTTE